MQLFIDAALINQTTLIALGDGGSGFETGGGLATPRNNNTSPYNIMVGGSSLSTLGTAAQDPTLNGTDASFTPIYSLAMAGDAATLWQLMSGGLSHLPSTAALGDWLVETAWNEYQTTDQQTFVGGNGPDGSSYLTNNTGAGGMDTTQATPAYQEDYGLTSAIYAALGLNGRALPDVVAPAGGNMFYSTPGPNMEALVGEGGTSAATPFWASLITQINYVFNDQGLPNLGYMTDLLYLASVIAPGSFNDVTMGNNTSSFSLGGADYGGITPTGYGYEAGTGYDLASGLGSPNGLLLARALTEIAHSQLYFSATPDVIDANAGGWTSGTAQTLLLQTTASADATATVTAGGDSIDAGSAAHAAYAWTSQLAQQSLQSDFDGDLLALFDGQTQGSLTQAIVAGGESVSVTFNGAAAVAAQANLSASFGFADFFSDATNSVRLAQAVAVAETAGGELQHLAVEMAAEIVGRSHDRVGDEMRQVGRDGEDAVVVLGVDALDLAAQTLPEGFELRHRVRIAVGQRRQDAPAALEQIEQRRLGAGILRARHRMCRHEVHALGDVRRHVGDHGLLHRTHVGDDAAGLERGGNRLGGRAAGTDGRADDHQVGIPAGFRQIGAAMVGELQLVGEGCGLGAARRRDDMLGEAALAGLQRDRAADQADADQRDLAEQRFAHFFAATKRASEACTAFTSVSVPTVMRRCSGSP